MQKNKQKKEVFYPPSKQKEIRYNQEIKKMLKKKNGIQFKLAHCFVSRLKETKLSQMPTKKEIAIKYLDYFKSPPTSFLIKIIEAKLQIIFN
jgi:hypothetical protein